MALAIGTADMGDDFEQLQRAEQKLLEAVKAATEVTSRLSEGETKGLEELCAQFMDCIQGSQEALVPLAAKYGEALPYESSDIGARLELEAAQQKLQAAEEQLQHLRQRLLERQPGGGGGEQQAPAQHAGDAAGGGG